LGEITAEHLAKFFANLAGGGLEVAAPVFFLGELVTTPRTLTLLADEHANPAELLACHQGVVTGGSGAQDARFKRTFALSPSARCGW
jgi:hypothetical protein